MNVDQINLLLHDVKFPGYALAAYEGHGGIYLQGAYMDEDVYTGRLMAQTTRKWLLSPHMTESEIVQTAFKCVLTSKEHDVRDRFTYRGQRIFGPHFDVNDLVELCERGLDNAGGRK